MAALILYYSRAAENYFGGSLKYIDKGNTEVVAEKAAKITGAELFKVEPVTPYSDDYNTCINEAKRDLNAGARPEVRALPDDFDKYDTVILMYPNYWGTMPMPMFTALEGLDFTGKTVCPLCTHEGSGLGRSEVDVKKCCKGADVKRGLAIRGSSVYDCDDMLKGWL